MKSGLVPTAFPTTFRTSLWPPPWPSGRPLDTKMVAQASFWTPFGSRFASKLAIVAPCENLIIYCVFITKTPFGTGRVPNKTFTCIHGASETTFCAFFSPLWRPRGAPGLTTELPESPRPPKNHLKIHQNHPRIHFGLQCSVSGCPGVRPPTKNDPKLTQNGCKCITFGASSLGLFGLTFPLNIVIGAKTLKHALHAKHHRMSVDRLSGHLGTWTYWTTHLLFRGTVAV